MGMGLLGPTDCPLCQSLYKHRYAIAIAIGALLLFYVEGIKP